MNQKLKLINHIANAFIYLTLLLPIKVVKLIIQLLPHLPTAFFLLIASAFALTVLIYSFVTELPTLVKSLKPLIENLIQFSTELLTELYLNLVTSFKLEFIGK